MYEARRIALETRHGSLDFGARCLVMGILNVTPDSFSDGGLYLDEASAVEHGRRMAAEGADVIDIGGESTRPGSEGVDDDEQIDRIVPVIRGLRRAGVAVPISMDTQSAVVAAAALKAGADIVNDVSGIRRDPAMAELLARTGVPFVVMHMQGTPATMQIAPYYEDVIVEIVRFFEERAAALARAGVDTARMIVDPGIGFGKTTEHNLTIVREIRRFAGAWPVLVGPSRKRFIQDVVGGGDGTAGTIAAAMHCALGGAGMVRVHEVGAIRRIVESLNRG